MLTMSLKAFTDRITTDDSFRRRARNGVSPGYAGARLGITRQGVHKALNTGLLDGVRLTSSGDTVAVLVFVDSLDQRDRERKSA